MSVFVVANPKGGVGKSTVSTQLAGALAVQGHAVALGDLDPQQSAQLWLDFRPPQAAAIQSWPVPQGALGRPPKGVRHAVLDTPAGLAGGSLKDVLKLADKIIVPLQPSVFDLFATHAFLEQLAGMKRAQGVAIGIVGMRVDERTIAADRLREFVASLGLAYLTDLRNTQNYVHLAAQGLTLFDVAPGRVEKDLEQWQPVLAWLDT